LTLLKRLLAVLVAGTLAAGCIPHPSPTPAPPATLAAAATPSSTALPTATTTATATATAVPSPTATATPSPSFTPDPVAGLLAGLSLEEKVGQMLLVGIPGLSFDEGARHAVSDLHAGGVTLLERNAESPEQLVGLLRQLQGVARLPLFVAINHEGGSIVRVQTGVTDFPNAMALGATGDPNLAYEVGRAGADELAAMGVNMNLAPVLDVNTEAANPVIGWRAFGGLPEEVAQFGAYFVHGTQDAGVIAVAKHFPGHGGVSVDSHLALPLVAAPAEQLWAVDLVPFRRAIAAGVSAIMSAHLAVPALTGDPALPATLAPAVMTGLLREQLGFRGLVITDDLDMKGITSQMSQAEAAVRAVEAGSDVVLVMGAGASEDATYAALLDAARSGRLSRARIDDSVRRILALKVRYGLFGPPERSLAVAGSPAHQALAQRVAEAAVTAVNAQGLPLAAGRRTLVISPQTLPAGSAAGDGWTLCGEEVRSRSAECRELLYNPASPADQARLLAQAVALATEYDQVVLGLWDADLQRSQRGDDTQFRLAEALAAAGTPLAVVAWHLPYDLAGAPAGAAALAAYGETEAQVRATVRVLFGEIPAQGRLPVPLG